VTNSLHAQLPILPVVLPLLAGALLALADRRAPVLARALGVTASATTLLLAVLLVAATVDGTVLAYRLGDWPAPFGIALAADRLAAGMLVVTALVAIACQLAASDGLARRAPRFGALLQLQVAGLNGAFLTADLFNLFVFYEVLLIASYALLLHAAGPTAVRAGLHYVVVNLLGSTLFLFAASLLYGALGTLNMADLIARAPAAPAAERPLVEAATLLLFVVFGIKAAALPLGFWLPGTYSAAAPPVAALFAIMTKVGVYSAVRMSPLLALETTGGSALLLIAGLATLAFAAVAALAARDLRALACWLVVASAGTLLALAGSGGSAAIGAALFYLPHTTFASAALFLVAGLVADARGAAYADRIEAGPAPGPVALLGVLYALAMMSLVGLPPLSGFVAKLLLLESVASAPAGAAIWITVLAAGLAMLIAGSRAASTIFWKAAGTSTAAPAGSPGRTGATPFAASRGTLAATLLLIACGLAIVPLAAPLLAFAESAGAQVAEPAAYVDAVLAPVEAVP
jgi:multicomponent K+:H+ antiporter subunit D